MYLKDITLFHSLSKKNLEQIKKISTKERYKAGNIIFYEGDKPTYLHILLDGVVKLYKTDSKGHQVYIHQFTPVSLIGELANFENMPFPATAEATTSCIILKIEYAKLDKDFLRNPDVSFEIIKSLSQKTKILSNIIHQEMILSTDAKIAKLIVEHIDLFEKLKNSQIASLVNITPETLSRILTKFKKNGYIKTSDNHTLLILNKDALEALYK